MTSLLAALGLGLVYVSLLVWPWALAVRRGKQIADLRVEVGDMNTECNGLRVELEAVNERRQILARNVARQANELRQIHLDLEQLAKDHPGLVVDHIRARADRVLSADDEG